MTLLDEIEAAFPNWRVSRDDGLIAAHLSVGRTKVVSTKIGIGTILRTLAPTGGEFLDQLVALGATERNVFWSMELIRSGEFDIGLAGARVLVSQVAIAFPSLKESIDKLLTLAVVPEEITPQMVATALEGIE
jgi:hypothetical protein